MVTWVDTRLLDPGVGMALHRHRLIRVVCINVLKEFLLAQGSSSLAVSRQPQPWGLSIQIVSDTEVILPCLNDLDLTSLGLLLLLGSGLSKHVVVAIAQVIQIEDLVVFLASASAIDDLHLGLFFIIDVENLLLLLVSFFLRVLSIDPAIFDFLLQVVGIILMELLELLDPFFAWDTPRDEVLLVLG